jgi:hypothetical protein
MENHLKFAICRLPFDLLVCLYEQAVPSLPLAPSP